MEPSNRKQNPHSRKLKDYQKKTRTDASIHTPHHNTLQTLKKINKRSHRRVLEQTLLASQNSGVLLNEDEAWEMENRVLSTDQLHASTPPTHRFHPVPLKEHIQQVQKKKTARQTGLSKIK